MGKGKGLSMLSDRGHLLHRWDACALQVQSPLSEVQVQATTKAAFEMGAFTVEADSQLNIDKKKKETWSKSTLKLTTVIPPSVQACLDS